MNKLVQIVRNHPDKVLHFIVGLILAQILFCIPYINIYAVIPAVATVGFAKEIVDEFENPGSFNGYDLLLTAVGGAIGSILMLVYSVIYETIHINNSLF